MPTLSEGETVIIGLTGGIASGKSAVANWFSQHKIPVIDADKIARQIVEIGQPALKKISQTFGSDFLQADGRLDRAKLGSYIFSRPIEKDKLDAIMQPYIYQQIVQEIKQHAQAPLIVVDMPLLYEFHYEKLVDQVMVVAVDEHTQLERLKQRNHLTDLEAKQRIQSQMPLSEKKKRADVVVDNNGSLEHTYQQVEKIVNKWLH